MHMTDIQWNWGPKWLDGKCVGDIDFGLLDCRRRGGMPINVYMYNFNWNGECLSHLSHIWCSFILVAIYTLHIVHMYGQINTRTFVNRAICNNVYMYMWKIHTCHAQHIFLERVSFPSHPLLISWMRGCMCNIIQKVAHVDNDSTVTLNTLFCST